MSKEIELAIIGAGIAGVSSAVYAKRSGLEFTLFEPKAVGGQLLWMDTIDNYAGLGLGAKGADLAISLDKTLTDLNISMVKQEITKLEIDKERVKLIASEDQYLAKTVIAATGAAFRKLGIKGEDEFLGKGVSFCAVCDGFFFKNKTVAVVGGGNTAVEEALYLSDIAGKVYLIHRRDQLRALDYLQKEVFKKDNIEILFDSQIKEIKGDQFLQEVVIENNKNNRSQNLALQGLFVAIGIKPATDAFKEVTSRDEGGFIITDEQMKSSCRFIWAAGDCRKRPLRQLITAASEGAIASIGVYKHLKGHYISV
jgi:thioredoxin reductase (NADPH)